MENTNGKKKPLFGLYDIVMVGVMAAIVFVLTYFVKIQIPTPTGPVMFKTANIFILLSGLLLRRTGTRDCLRWDFWGKDRSTTLDTSK